MGRKIVNGLVVGLLGLFGAVCSGPVSALDAEPTPDTHWLHASPLMISAYQRSSSSTYGGDDLRLVELYNDGDQPIDVTTWIIRGTFKKAGSASTEIASMNIVPRLAGMLSPGSHAIVDAGAGVANASYEMTTWSSPKPNGTLISLTVIPPTEGIATNEYTLKATGSLYTELWRRTPLTTPGYTATLSSFSVSPLQLFDDGLYSIPNAPPLNIIEIYPYASDCTPFDVSILCGDYIKLYNPTDEVIDLDDFALRTDSSSVNRTSTNTVQLSGKHIDAHGYLTVGVNDNGERLSLTNDGGYVWVEDRWGLRRYDETLAQYASAGTTKQGYSWAQKDSSSWDWSSTPMPDAPNSFPVVPPQPTTPEPLGECPVGKYRNPETNRCRTIEEVVNTLTTCPEGQYRNSETNRCRSVVATTAVVTPCGEGQERNPATNRCRSIASAVAELIPCDEGYERNPATNRCKKVMGVSTIMPSITKAADEASSVGVLTNPYGIASVVVAGGVGYAIYEWRSEIRDGYKRLAAKIGTK